MITSVAVTVALEALPQPYATFVPASSTFCISASNNSAVTLAISTEAIITTSTGASDSNTSDRTICLPYWLSVTSTLEIVACPSVGVTHSVSTTAAADWSTVGKVYLLKPIGKLAILPIFAKYRFDSNTGIASLLIFSHSDPVVTKLPVVCVGIV